MLIPFFIALFITGSFVNNQKFYDLCQENDFKSEKCKFQKFCEEIGSRGLGKKDE
jgi:hypothetical protein